MKSIFIIKSAATIALCAMLFSCSKKINLATSQQSTKETPSAKHTTISGWNAPSVYLKKEDRPVSKSLSVIKTETLHQEIETPVSTNSKTTTKKSVSYTHLHRSYHPDHRTLVRVVYSIRIFCRRWSFFRKSPMIFVAAQSRSPNDLCLASTCCRNTQIPAPH